MQRAGDNDRPRPIAHGVADARKRAQASSSVPGGKASATGPLGIGRPRGLCALAVSNIAVAPSPSREQAREQRVVNGFDRRNEQRTVAVNDLHGSAATQLR